MLPGRGLSGDLSVTLKPALRQLEQGMGSRQRLCLDEALGRHERRVSVRIHIGLLLRKVRAGRSSVIEEPAGTTGTREQRRVI